MKIDEELKKAIRTIKEVFDSKKIESCIIGALVPHIKIAVKLGISSRQTMDVDYLISVSGWKEFNEIKVDLEKKGFTKTSAAHRMRYGDHSIVDLIPYGRTIVKNGVIRWPQDESEMHVGGFEHKCLCT